MKTAEEFIKELDGSEALRKEFGAINEKEAFEEFLKKHSVGATAEELAKAFKARSESEGELGDDDAEAVAGGGFWEDMRDYYERGFRCLLKAFCPDLKEDPEPCIVTETVG